MRGQSAFCISGGSRIMRSRKLSMVPPVGSSTICGLPRTKSNQARIRPSARDLPEPGPPSMWMPLRRASSSNQAARRTSSWETVSAVRL